MELSVAGCAEVGFWALKRCRTSDDDWKYLLLFKSHLIMPRQRSFRPSVDNGSLLRLLGLVAENGLS